MKTWVLVSTSRGDDLLPSKNTAVAASHDRDKLEAFRKARADERAAYLATHSIPYGSESVIIEEENIVEVITI